MTRLPSKGQVPVKLFLNEKIVLSSLVAEGSQAFFIAEKLGVLETIPVDFP
jgi:hypothetical protein